MTLAPFEYPHIGELIDTLIYRKGMTKKALGDVVGMSQGNATYITKRKSLDVITVHRIGYVLQYDFWQHYPIPVSHQEQVKAADAKDKTIAELQAKIAEMEKENEKTKMQLDALRSENGLMRDMIAVWKRK
jgi:hypothetical protein